MKTYIDICAAAFFAFLGLSLLIVVVNLSVMTWNEIREARHKRMIERLRAEKRLAEIA